MNLIDKIDLITGRSQLEEDTMSLLAVTTFIQPRILIEGMMGNIMGSFNNILNKIGLDIHKAHGKSLIGVLSRAPEFMTEFIWYLFKYSIGDKAAGERVKELSKSIRKEDVIDFLLKLDSLTLHTISGPIHMLEVLTGWHISPAIERKEHDAVDRAKAVIKNLSAMMKTATEQVKISLSYHIDSLMELFGLEPNEVR